MAEFHLDFAPPPGCSSRICIVGAGISGLCACRHLLRRGIRPTVLEASAHIGGVWRSNSVGITKLQTPSIAYQFSDFPWPPGTPHQASAAQVLDYLADYAARFGVLDCVRFGAKVVELRRHDDRSSWEVLVRQGEADPEIIEFDFVILCIGRFGDVPRLPSFPPGQGAEIFNGRVLHSSEFSALHSEAASELLCGKNVVIVGFSKSALDVAAEAVEANRGSQGKQCTLLFRRAHWIVKHWNAFGTNIAYFYGTRLSEMCYHKPGQSFFSKLLTSLLWPLKWCTSKLVEIYLRWTLSLSHYDIVPNVPFHEQLASCKVSVMPDNFLSYIDQGHLKLRKSPNWHFTQTGIMLDNKEELQAEVVVLATGFQGETKLTSLLPKRYAQVLRGPDGVVPLYRGIIHPRIPGMAILGYQEDISNIRASEMGARWLSYYLTGKVKLPNSEEMSKNANAWVSYMKRSTPYFDKACVTLTRIWHTDEQCRDIGWNPKRKKNWLQEIFSPYSNMDYID